MKRSEAIAQMAGFLSGFVWYEERHPEELMQLAEHVILGAEKIGMRPPIWYTRFYSQDENGNDSERLNMHHEWEPEDA